MQALARAEVKWGAADNAHHCDNADLFEHQIVTIAVGQWCSLGTVWANKKHIA